MYTNLRLLSRVVSSSCCGVPAVLHTCTDAFSSCLSSPLSFASSLLFWNNRCYLYRNKKTLQNNIDFLSTRYIKMSCHRCILPVYKFYSHFSQIACSLYEEALKMLWQNHQPIQFSFLIKLLQHNYSYYIYFHHYKLDGSTYC